MTKEEIINLILMVQFDCKPSELQNIPNYLIIFESMMRAYIAGSNTERIVMPSTNESDREKIHVR
jgi:hypothetical protein